MARIRTVKPTFFTSITISELPLTARLTFIGLWTYCDDHGRGRDDVRLVKAAVWPLDDRHTFKKVEVDLQTLEKANLIERYTHADQRFLRIRSWTEHQKVSHPSPSAFPPSPEETLNDSGEHPEGSGKSPEGSGNFPGGKEGNKERNKDSERNGRSGESSGARPRDAATPPENEPAPADHGKPPWMTDPLVDRWCTTVTGNDRRPHRMHVWRIIDHCRHYLDSAVIDETIGRLAQLDAKPGSPNYLLATLTTWGAERNIKIPPLEQQAVSR